MHLYSNPAYNDDQYKVRIIIVYEWCFEKKKKRRKFFSKRAAFFRGEAALIARFRRERPANLAGPTIARGSSARRDATGSGSIEKCATFRQVDATSFGKLTPERNETG